MKYDLAVIGAGACGLVVAIGAAQAKKKVLLIEKGAYGGDCTNRGCIPSKSLIHSAQIAYSLKQAKNLGINILDPKIETTDLFPSIQRVIKEFQKEESSQILQDKGVETFNGSALFIDNQTLELTKNSQKTTIQAKKIVIATGSRPLIPSIEGINEINYLTNQTLFQLEKVPQELTILGAGAIGSEMAQAFARLGSKVTLIEFFDRILIKEEASCSDLIKKIFIKENIQVFTNSKVIKVETIEHDTVLHIQCLKEKKVLKHSCKNLLIATGRVANTESLNLKKTDVTTENGWIEINRYGQTKAASIFAAGDVIGKSLFTHSAEMEARAILYNLLLPKIFWKKLFQQTIPQVTFTDPEIASIGLKEKEAKDIYGSCRIHTYKIEIQAIDRAKTERKESGFMQIVTLKWSSKILGATIVSPRAGEILMEISLAILHDIPLRKLASLIHPYPIYSQGIRKLSDLWFKEVLFPKLLSLTRWFQKN